jgi:hypothetical protein
MNGSLQVAHALPLLLALASALTAPPCRAAESASLEFEIVDQAGWSRDVENPPPQTPGAAAAAPTAAVTATKVTETYTYDAAADTLTIDYQFDRKGFAPLPPMLAVALEQGFPIAVTPQARPGGRCCAIGPLVGVPEADHIRCQIAGLGKYVFPPASGPGAAAAAPAAAGGSEAAPGREALLAELHAEVEKILAAPVPLRPWLALVNVPGSGFPDRGDVYWANPGETLYLLADAAPLLKPDLRVRLLEYLRAFRKACPPQRMRSLSFTQGEPREASPMDKKLLEKWEKKNLAYRVQGPPTVWALYGLARYYQAVGEKPDADTMAACNAVVAAALEHRDWATLYWRRGHSPEYNAVHAVNQLFAGFVGYIRLARLAGETKAEALGWGLLARLAVLRHAMGKYTQFQYAHHMFNVKYRGYCKHPESSVPIRVETDPKLYELPADPAWWVKADGKEWMGNLRTWHWSAPIDNVRQVTRLDESGLDVWEYGAVDCSGLAIGKSLGQHRDPDKNDYWYDRLSPYYLPFADLTPELAAFLAAHLKPECAAYLARVEENQPTWHLTYCEAILSAENGFMTPPNAHSLFLAKAWVLGEKPAALERLVDVPWLPRGDLFHIHKLTAACGGGGGGHAR